MSGKPTMSRFLVLTDDLHVTMAFNLDYVLVVTLVDAGQHPPYRAYVNVVTEHSGVYRMRVPDVDVPTAATAVAAIYRLFNETIQGK